MDIFIAERCAVKVAVHERFDRVNDEIDAFDGCIDDAEFFDGARKDGAEKLAIEILDDLLFAAQCLYIRDIIANGCIEALEGVRVDIFLESVRVEKIDHGLHRARNGVVFGKMIILEERVKDGTRNDVLGEEFDTIVALKGIVDISMEAAHKAFKLCASVSISF